MPEQKPQPKKPDAVKSLQDYAKKKAAEDAEKKKKQPAGIKTAPSQGVLSRLGDFISGKMTGTEKK
jgi:hypothetical protein